MKRSNDHTRMLGLQNRKNVDKVEKDVLSRLEAKYMGLVFVAEVKRKENEKEAKMAARKERIRAIELRDAENKTKERLKRNKRFNQIMGPLRGAKRRASIGADAMRRASADLRRSSFDARRSSTAGAAPAPASEALKAVSELALQKKKPRRALFPAAALPKSPSLRLPALRTPSKKERRPPGASPSKSSIKSWLRSATTSKKRASSPPPDDDEFSAASAGDASVGDDDSFAGATVGGDSVQPFNDDDTLASLDDDATIASGGGARSPGGLDDELVVEDAELEGEL